MKQGTRSSRKPGGAKKRFGGGRGQGEKRMVAEAWVAERGIVGVVTGGTLGLGLGTWALWGGERERNFQGGNPWKWKGERESTGESGWTFPRWSAAVVEVVAVGWWSAQAVRSTLLVGGAMEALGPAGAHQY